MFKNIVLGVDGSVHAIRAAKMAGKLAREVRAANLWVVVAYDPIPSYLGEPYMQQVVSARLKDAESILKGGVDAVGKIPGRIHQEVLEGSPAEEIIKVASLRKSDLIIMGSRGRGTVARLLLGSQSQKVISHAPCPVLIVK